VPGTSSEISIENGDFSSTPTLNINGTNSSGGNSGGGSSSDGDDLIWENG